MQQFLIAKTAKDVSLMLTMQPTWANGTVTSTPPGAHGDPGSPLQVPFHDAWQDVPLCELPSCVQLALQSVPPPPHCADNAQLVALRFRVVVVDVDRKPLAKMNKYKATEAQVASNFEDHVVMAHMSATQRGSASENAAPPCCHSCCGE